MVYASVWQTPVATRRTRHSPARGPSRSISSITSGWRGSQQMAERTFTGSARLAGPAPRRPERSIPDDLQQTALLHAGVRGEERAADGPRGRHDHPVEGVADAGQKGKLPGLGEVERQQLELGIPRQRRLQLGDADRAPPALAQERYLYQDDRRNPGAAASAIEIAQQTSRRSPDPPPLHVPDEGMRIEDAGLHFTFAWRR